MTETGAPRYVTGSEVGLSGAEQIRIALDVMIQNGGSAKTNQITKAVEGVLATRDHHSRLSKQGKASLRFFINKVAVNAGYVYKYDSRGPGWRITPKGYEYIAPSTTTHFNTKMLTPIGQDFQLALSDVYTLLEADKQITANNNIASATFIRSGIILTVTAWETFIEDTIKAHFTDRIGKAMKAENVLPTFNTVAHAWIDKFGDKRPKPPDLLKWSGDGWKAIITDHFNDAMANFNTPKSDNIIALFKRYIDFDIKSIWTWPSVTPDDACAKLDAMVTIRGALVHRGRTSTEAIPNINREQLITMITLVEQLAWATEVELNSKLPQ